MSSIRKFKLLEGIHQDASGKNYKKGDIVPSTANLSEIFLHKFEEVAASAPVSKPTAPVELPSAKDDDPAKISGEEKKDDDQQPPEDAPLSHPDGKGRGALGDDVTKDFQSAKDADLKVFTKGGWHYVTEPDKTDVALNEKALKKAGVDEFIKKFLA
jgi:hypothetical protein